jgi:hypothetical protein
MLSDVRRRLVAGALALVVPVATLLGLFVHEHPDDHETDHHAARAIHAHFGGHTHASHHDTPDGPAISDDDDHDRAVYLAVYVGEALAAPPLVAVVPHEVDVRTPAVRRSQPPLLVVHGHDPPALTDRPSRAPPRLPVLI